MIVVANPLNWGVSPGAVARAACLVAVSPSPRPWMDVFAPPEKSNMAVTESDPDPKVGKMAITFQWLCDVWAEHAGMERKCYWF